MSLQEKEYTMVVLFKLKIPSLVISVQHHSVSLVMHSCYPRGGIFNPHLTNIKDSYIIYLSEIVREQGSGKMDLKAKDIVM